ncbi:MAG: hypothetical protein K5796_04600 [Lachnospiraceae bacterium]|nr:hypothetical protein [Lachnospiraceae bacterium]
MKNSEEPHKTAVSAGNTAPSTPAYSSAAASGKPFPVKIVAIAAVALIVLIAIISIVSSRGSSTVSSRGSSTINLNQFVEVKASGYDGYGTATVSINWDAMEKKYGEKLRTTDQNGWKINQYISVQLDKDKQLSNKDVVTYKLKVREDEFIKNFPFKFKYSDGTYKVSGLETIKKFDAFADVKVTFTGIAPESSRVEIEYTGTEFEQRDFSYSSSGGSRLSNGDVVTVTLKINDITKYAQENGRVPETVTKEYTVSGLKEYPASFSGFSKEYVTSIQTEAEAYVKDYFAVKYEAEVSVSDLKYEGYIASVWKEDKYIEGFYLIFSGTVSISGVDMFSPTKLYFPVGYKKTIVFPDNIPDELYELDDDEVMMHGYYPSDKNLKILTSYYYYSTPAGGYTGYKDPGECYDAVAKELTQGWNEGKVDVESGDGFEKYAK